MGTASVIAPPVSSNRSGMGAIPYEGGVTFRVWAKFPAQGKVAVVGDFNSWKTDTNPLGPDGDSGYWSVDVPGAKIGDEYQYFIPGAGNGGFKMDPYASSISQTSGFMHAVVTPRDTAYVGGYTTPKWNEAVIYELHIPTFTSVDAAHEGDFDTAFAKLADLADMGINAIEIMPLGQFKGISATGYNPGYIFAVEDSYGGPDEFRDFVNNSHAIDVAVILDVVYNHLGDTDLWQFDGWFTPDRFCPFPHTRPVETQGGIYFYQDSRAHTDFAHTRFDFGRPEVQQYVLDNVLRWTHSRFVDGLRFDSVVNIRGVQVGADYEFDLPDGKALLCRVNQELQQTQPWKLTIAEDLQNYGAITQPVDQGGFGFGAQWNNSFCFALRNAVLEFDDAARPISTIAYEINAISGAAAFKTVIYSENHDRNDPGQGGGRINQMISPGSSDSWAAKKRSTLAAAVVLTSPGIPMLFQGQEFMEWRPFPTSGNPNPEPIDWSLRDKFSGIRNLYRDLIYLRRNWFNNTRGLRGANTHVLPVFDDNMLIFHRWDQGGASDDVVVVCNFANQGHASYTIGFPSGGMWRVRFNSDAGSYDAFFSNWNSFDTSADGPPLNGMPCSGNIEIAPYSCIILSQD